MFFLKHCPLNVCLMFLELRFDFLTFFYFSCKMADSASDDENSPKISIKFKTTTDVYELNVSEKAGVSKVVYVLVSI